MKPAFRNCAQTIRGTGEHAGNCADGIGITAKARGGDQALLKTLGVMKRPQGGFERSDDVARGIEIMNFEIGAGGDTGDFRIRIGMKASGHRGVGDAEDQLTQEGDNEDAGVGRGGGRVSALRLRVGDLHCGVGVMKIAQGDRREADQAAIAGAGGIVAKTCVDACFDEAADGSKRAVASIDASALASIPAVAKPAGQTSHEADA